MLAEQKYKVAWLSDSPFTVTGYANMTARVLNGLSELGNDCNAFAHNYLGQTIAPGLKLDDGTQFNFSIYGSGRQPYFQELIMPRLREVKPDVFVILLDTFMTYPWLLDKDFAPAKSIFYFPSDGEGGLPQACEAILKKIDLPIAMSKFGQKQVLDKYGIKAEYIPHAIDEKIYYPLPDQKRQQLKAKYNLTGKFVVGSVFRNQGRKMSDRLLKAFALFAKKVSNAVLFLHTDPDDGAAPYNMRLLINRLGIQNRVIFTGMNFFNGFDYQQMNEIYNVMDVFFLTTSGEGFGVPTIEAMACGVPPIVTDYTTTQELVVDNGQCGEPIKLQTEVTGGWTVDRGVCDIQDASDKLYKLYEDEKLRNHYAEVGIEKIQKYYTWKVVIPMWDKIIKELIE